MNSEVRTSPGFHCKDCDERTLHIRAAGDTGETWTCSVCGAKHQAESARS